MKPKYKKCKTDDCKNMVDLPYRYCSIECGIYDNYFERIDGKVVINKIKLTELESENND